MKNNEYDYYHLHLNDYTQEGTVTPDGSSITQTRRSTRRATQDTMRSHLIKPQATQFVDFTRQKQKSYQLATDPIDPSAEGSGTADMAANRGSRGPRRRAERSTGET
ncbi:MULTISPECIES: hypothetical protein [unclassified Frankia]|uniref:hypothetical protein n=1 Tax=unclassified Frankia TaxID=2632575 RepID=UPI001EF5596B|nr:MULTISPECIES: hypothetical protein [unclassified Frankia]